MKKILFVVLLLAFSTPLFAGLEEGTFFEMKSDYDHHIRVIVLCSVFAVLALVAFFLVIRYFYLKAKPKDTKEPKSKTGFVYKGPLISN